MAIHIQKSHQGRLHRALHVPEGQKIPASKLEAALHSKNPAIRKEANFARNASKWHKDSDPESNPAFLGEDFSGGPVRQHYEGMMRPNPK